ncbi:hypothetical protein, partial [Acetomicrobium sp. S15 = DSM 107314]|uniref:hypothetical protein n=1 Tax=Acetomicrobium sp. S15 = DSM 107314 TaxID=2529858 RepID=UPI001E3088DA
EGVDFEEIEEAVRESVCAGANGPFPPAHTRCGYGCSSPSYKTGDEHNHRGELMGESSNSKP